jgi:O-antigen/teichoic acid export membrane protein
MTRDGTCTDRLEAESLPAQQRDLNPCDAPRAKGSFLTHAAIYGFGSLALQAATVLLVPVYTQCLKPAEFGVLEVLTRVGEILSICLLVHGVRMAGFTFYCQAQGEPERERTAATILLTPMILLVACGLMAAGFSPYLGRLIGIEDSGLVAFAILMIIAEGMTVAPLTLIQARVESGYFIFIMAMMFCLRLALTVLLVVFMQWGLWGVLMASTATSLAFGVLLTWRELRRSPLVLDLKKLREILIFALPFVPAGLCNLVLHNGDRFFLMRYCGADEVGLYALGYRLAMAVGMFSAGPLLQVWAARVFDAFQRPDASVFVGRVCTRILAVYLFAGIGACLFDEDLIAILAMPSYHGATALVDPLTLAYFFWSAANLLDAPIWVRRRSGLKPWIFFLSGSATLGLYVWLIPSYGALGAACATLAGLMVHCAVTFVVSQRLFHVQYEFGRLFVMLGLAIAMVAAEHYTGPGAIGFAQKAALWTAWPLLLWFTGVVTQEEKTFVLTACLRAWAWLGCCLTIGRRRPLCEGGHPGDEVREGGICP